MMLCSGQTPLETVHAADVEVVRDLENRNNSFTFYKLNNREKLMMNYL